MTMSNEFEELCSIADEWSVVSDYNQPGPIHKHLAKTAIAFAEAERKRNAPPRGECCKEMRRRLTMSTSTLHMNFDGVIRSEELSTPFTYCPFCGAYCGRKEEA